MCVCIYVYKTPEAVPFDLLNINRVILERANTLFPPQYRSSTISLLNFLVTIFPFKKISSSWNETSVLEQMDLTMEQMDLTIDLKIKACPFLSPLP